MLFVAVFPYDTKTRQTVESALHPSPSITVVHPMIPRPGKMDAAILQVQSLLAQATVAVLVGAHTRIDHAYIAQYDLCVLRVPDTLPHTMVELHTALMCLHAAPQQPWETMWPYAKTLGSRPPPPAWMRRMGDREKVTEVFAAMDLFLQPCVDARPDVEERLGIDPPMPESVCVVVACADFQTEGRLFAKMKDAQRERLEDELLRATNGERHVCVDAVLERLCASGRVLFMNTAGTRPGGSEDVRKHAHLNIWGPYFTALVGAVCDASPACVFIVLGRDSDRYFARCNTSGGRHLVLRAGSPLSGAGFEQSGVFKNADEWLRQRGIPTVFA